MKIQTADIKTLPGYAQIGINTLIFSLFLFSSFIFAQLYAKGNVEITVKEGTLLHISDTKKVITEPAAVIKQAVIHVVEGTVTHNLEAVKNVEIAVIRLHKKPEKNYFTSNTKTTEKKAKSISLESNKAREKDDHKQRFKAKSENNDSFLFLKSQVGISTSANPVILKLLLLSDNHYSPVMFLSYRIKQSCNTYKGIFFTSVNQYLHRVRPPPSAIIHNPAFCKLIWRTAI